MSYRQGAGLSQPLNDHTEEWEEIKYTTAFLLNYALIMIQDTGIKPMWLPTQYTALWRRDAEEIWQRGSGKLSIYSGC